MSDAADLVVVGAGIVGLAHAWAAVSRGLRVTVVERDHACVGASVRNFGFVTVTGQGEGDTWRRARRSRDVWADIAPRAGIRIEHRGLWMLARRPEAGAVLEAFAATPMGRDCDLHTAAEAGARAPHLRCDRASCALYSPHELRVESRDAVPKLARWLAAEHGVRFVFGEAVLDIDAPRVTTSRQVLRGERVVLCPGTELTGLAARHLARHDLGLTRLQMLRVVPDEGLRLAAAVMSDLSLVRYRGYATLPEAAVLRARLEHEAAAELAHGIHLIVVQGEDGSLVVGDSHHAQRSASPFASEEVDELILRELRQVLDLGRLRVQERWVGTYPVGGGGDALVEPCGELLRVVVVTSGTGASTAFALAEDVMDNW